MKAGIIAGAGASLVTTGLFLGSILCFDNLNQDEGKPALVGSLDSLNKIEET